MAAAAPSGDGGAPLLPPHPSLSSRGRWPRSSRLVLAQLIYAQVPERLICLCGGKKKKEVEEVKEEMEELISGAQSGDADLFPLL